MSRSFRKPYYTDQQVNSGSKRVRADKRSASRAVRKAKEVANGKQYRKEYNSWDIRDWSFYSPNDPKAKRK